MSYLKNQDIIKVKLKGFKNIALLFVAYSSAILTFNGGGLSIIVSTVVLCSILFLFFDNDFYLILPLLIFFHSQLVISEGIVVYRIYSILLLIKIFTSNKIKIDKRQLIPLVIIVFYSLIVISTNNFRMAISIIFDMFVIIFYISTFLNKKENITRFFKFYTFAALSSSIYGFIRMEFNMKTAIYLDGKWIKMSRILATFNDPNYVGFFFNIAIFSILSIYLFKNKFIKWSFITIFYLIIFSTISMTAILCNLLGISIYLVYKRSINIKYILISIIILVGFSYFYTSALKKDIPIISNVAIRIKSELNALSNKNYDLVTSNRTAIWKRHLKYYCNQPIHKFFLGGNCITDYVYDKALFEGVSHQALIDMLLNFGLLGTIIIMYFYLYNMIKHFIKYIQHKEEYDFFIFMIKFIWLFYAFGLSMFPSWKFNLFFFI